MKRSKQYILKCSFHVYETEMELGSNIPGNSGGLEKDTELSQMQMLKELNIFLPFELCQYSFQRVVGSPSGKT